jgi:nucleotide sugar dehydrogenase
MDEVVGVVGLGRIGLPLALVFSKQFKVYAVDLNERRIQQIVNNERFPEPKVNEYLEKYRENIFVSTDYDILKNCGVVFVVTQTPSLPSGKFDVSYVKSAITSVLEKNSDCLIVVSSTINIGDMEEFRKIYDRIAYNPEFIRQGTIINDFENPKFVLVGAYSPEDAGLVAGIWSKVSSKPVYVVSPVEAEIIKLSLNISYSLGITFANIIGELCARFNANSSKVLDVIYQDRRNYKPGLGFAGPCFPRDVNCFREICAELSIGGGYKLANLLNDLNDYTLERYYRMLASFGKKKIGVLGLAYKPGVPYLDESQSLKIAQKLLENGYEVYVYDKLAAENARRVLPEECFCASLEECLDKSEIVFVGTSDFSNVRTGKPVVNPFS